MTLGERLKAAIKHAGLSVREFHRKMGPGGRRVPGASYPNVHRYLGDRAEPSQQFLREAADLCGVREKWLIAEAGLMTEAEEASDPVFENICAGFYRDGDAGVPTWLDTPLRRAALLNAWRRKYERYVRAARREYPDAEPGSLPSAGEGGGSIGTEVAIRIGDAMRATLGALDVDFDRLSEEGRDAFVLALVQGIVATAEASPAPATVIGFAYVTPSTQPKKPRTAKRRPKKKAQPKKTRK